MLVSDRRRWPTEIKLSADKRTLSVAFEDGARIEALAELLRVESPSAEVQGHGPTEKTTPAGKGEVRIVGVDPVGNYAIRLTFDDGHSTGIYGWDLLYDLGTRQEELMAAYLDRLRAAGASREPRPGRR
jgi:DUF971 family protein